MGQEKGEGGRGNSMRMRRGITRMTWRGELCVGVWTSVWKNAFYVYRVSQMSRTNFSSLVWKVIKKLKLEPQSYLNVVRPISLQFLVIPNDKIKSQPIFSSHSKGYFKYSYKCWEKNNFSVMGN